METPTNNTNVPPKYKIFVKTVSNKVIPMLCTPNTSIISLKLAIQQQEKIPVNSQRLIADAKILDDKLFLRDYPTVLKENGVIFCLLNLPDTQKVQQALQGQAQVAPKPQIPQSTQQHPISAPTTTNSQENKIPEPKSNTSQVSLPSSASSIQNEAKKESESVEEPEKQKKETKEPEKEDDYSMDKDEDLDNENEDDGSSSPHKKKDKESSKKKKRGKYSKRACIPCKKAHSACDSGRPCKRCLSLGLGHLCQDAERKKPRRRPAEEPNRQTYSSLTDFLPLLQKLPTGGPEEGNESTNKGQTKEISQTKASGVETMHNHETNDNAFAANSVFQSQNGEFDFDDESNFSRDSMSEFDNATFSGNNYFPTEDYQQPHHSLFEDEKSDEEMEDISSLNTNFSFNNADNSPSASTFNFAATSPFDTLNPDANSEIMQKIFVTYIQQAAELEQVKNLLGKIQNIQNLGNPQQYLQQM